MGLNQVRASKSLKGLLSGTFDPSVTALEATRGSLYYKTSAPAGLFQKQDNGLSTNWSAVGGGGGGGATGFEWPTDSIIAGDVGKMTMLDLTTKKAEVYSYQLIAGVSYLYDRITSQPAPGDTMIFTVTPPFGTVTLTAGVDFVIGGTLDVTITNIVAALNANVTYNVVFAATKIDQYIKHTRSAFAQVFDTVFSGTPVWGKTVGTSGNYNPTGITSANSVPLGTISGVNGANAIIDSKNIFKAIAGERIPANTFVIPANGSGKMVSGALESIQQSMKSSLLAVTQALADGDSFLVWDSFANSLGSGVNIGELVSVAGM